jgi:bifunctional non-homologous end joining protein LigD
VGIDDLWHQCHRAHITRIAASLAALRGMRYSEHLKGDGREIFEHVCRMGLEGIVSKRRDSPYISGRAKCWI